MRFLKTLPFIILITWFGFFVGSHQENIVENLNQQIPRLTTVIEDNAPKWKETAQQSVQAIQETSSEGLTKVKDLIDQFSRQDQSNPIRQDLSVKTQNEDSLKISSFNIRIFSNGSRDNEEIDAIAGILKEYDLIAIQEIRDEHVMRRTAAALHRMGYDYDFDLSPPVGRTVKERYAFLFKKNKVRQIRKGQLYNDRQDQFIREPFFASFKAGHFDFTLITFHALYGNSEKDRRPEIVKLADVYNDVAREDPDEKDIILLGDFNFPPEDSGFANLKRNKSMVYLFKSPERTTITDTSLYDNLWFQSDYVREFSGQAGINRFDETLFHNDDQKAKLAVSDHRPVWAIFNTEQDDD